VRNLTLTETLTFDRNINVTLQGGYNAGFASRTGSTILNGGMSVTAGSASFTSFTIK
jgi:hypothetical protein